MNTNDNSKIVRIIAILVFVMIIGTGLYVVNHREPEIKIKEDAPISSIENKNESNIVLEDADILYDTEFGGVYVKVSIPYFNALGFEYGDSVNVKFSNGYELNDIPYYNGYYTLYGDPLVVAYPGYEYIRVGINFGEDLWELAHLSEDNKCTITLIERAKYLNTQMVRDVQYSDEQGDSSDDVFGNFRAVNIGNLKENILYRGASPIDNKHNRAPVVDRLLEKEKIAFVIDIADDEDEIAQFLSGEGFNSPYFKSLLDNNKVVLLGMEAFFKSDAYSQKLVHGLTEASKNEGPYFVHCQEGKDRTGYVCIIIEALAGATYDELVEDYMKTYDNYYGITKESDKEKYDLIKVQNVDEMIDYFVGDESVEVETANLQDYAISYLTKIGMKEEDIQALRAKLEK